MCECIKKKKKLTQLYEFNYTKTILLHESDTSHVQTWL